MKWLQPGIGVKRWIGLGVAGVLLLVVGSAYMAKETFWLFLALDSIICVCGIILLILGIKMMMRSFVTAFMPSKDTQLFDVLYQHRHLARGPKVVTIGGGTGLSVLLSGLKEYTTNISAIVTMADDGGSSGRLRQEFDILPPGDIRNCLVALADAPTLMRDLFQFRFKTSSDLSGHSFGNLFITVMTQLTGDFEKAVKETSKVLALRGQVIPSTLNKVTLRAEHKDGSTTIGEEKIPQAQKRINKVFLSPEFPQATPDAVRAIEEAQVIILGPGSLYTSIIPNLLIKEIAGVVVASGALKIYVCNVMTQPGETDGLSVSEHIRGLIAHTHPKIIDYCLISNSSVPQDTLRRYALQGSYLVSADKDTVEEMGYRIIEDDFTVVDGGVIRHDPKKLASIILGLIEEV